MTTNAQTTIRNRLPAQLSRLLERHPDEFGYVTKFAAQLTAPIKKDETSFTPSLFHEFAQYLSDLTSGEGYNEEETLEQGYKRELVQVSEVAARCADIMCDLAALCVEESRLLGDDVYAHVKRVHDDTCNEIDNMQ